MWTQTRDDRQAPPPDARQRLDSLDGLRGVAALAVVIYHYTTRWTVPWHSETLYPFGTVFPDHLPFLAMAGHFGVHLFFVTSGFVILLTLERSSGLLEFGVRRIARLWPTMLVCATLSAVIINLSGFAERVASLDRVEVTWLEYVSSLFFIDPALVAGLIGAPPSQWVEGVYWTLWAEIRFYILIALTWRLAGPGRFIWCWLGFQLASLGLASGLLPQSGSGTLDLLASLVLQPDQLIWFSFGLSAYYGWTRRFGVGQALILAASLAGLLVAEPGHLFATNAGVLLVFIVALAPGPQTRALTSPLLLSIGLASYPLYLFHERVGTILLHDLGAAGVPSLILLPGVSLAAISVALIIHRLVEDPARRAIRAQFEPWSDRVQARWPVLRFSGSPSKMRQAKP